MRFLKKYIRKLYHLIWFLSALLIFSPRVYAIEENTNIGDTNFYTPPYATFGDVTNNYVTRYEGVSSHNVYYAPANLVTNGANTDGMAVAFSHESLFIQGYYYNVTMLVGFSSDSAYPKATSNRVCIGHNLTEVIDRYNANVACTSAYVYTWDNVSPFTTYDGTQLYLGMISYIFTSPATAKSFIGVMNSSVRKVGYQIFGGVYVEQLADSKTYNGLSAQDMHNILNNSGLATASSVQEVQRSIQEVKQEISEVADSVDNVNDTLNDSNVDSSDTTINSLKNQIPTNSVISDLLLLPIRFLQNFVNALNSSCSQFNLGSLYGTNLYMPCINLENYLGSTIWTMIDLIFSGMFVYGLRKKFIQIYENITNLKNGVNEVD